MSDAATTSAETAQAPQAPQAPPAPAPATKAPDYAAMRLPLDDRPEWLGEEYVDRDTGDFVVGRALKRLQDSQAELSKLKAKRVPEGGYQFKVPETFGDQVPADNPLFTVLGEWAGSRNIGQDDVDELVGAVLDRVAEAHRLGPEATKAALTEVYGSKAAAVMKGNAAFVEAFKNDPAVHATLTGLLSQPAAQRALKAIRDHFGDQAAARTSAAAPAPPVPTLDELRALMARQDYQRGEAAIVAKVNKMWEAYAAAQKST